VRGQQAGLSESGSKLPHSKTPPSPLLARLHNSFAQHAAKMGQHLEVVVMAGGLIKQDLCGVRELSST
jgi:hypothetical protein